MTASDRPDLAKGVLVDALAPGEMIEGSYEGDSVLLVRIENAFFAVGGECTHYGAPLCQGVLRGTTLLCPWHHARFDLASGHAVGPPALSGLQRYRVVAEGGRVRIAGSLPAPVESKRPARHPDSVLIVGAGAAGAVAAETLREEGFKGSVTLLELEPTGPVDRPNLSKQYLAGDAPKEWIPLRSDDFYRKREIELQLERGVEAINPKDRTVTLADGDDLEWDALLLATGAAPVRLSIPGAQLPHVFTLRSLRDADAIIGMLERSHRAVVAGASFIGLEVAAALRARKLEVHVVAPESTPMEGILGPDLGAFVRELHEEKGVHFHLGQTLDSIALDHVGLSGGSSIPTELVVVGIGVKPRTELAAAAGLLCNDGVLVNEFLETNLPGIWAAGDIARWPDPRAGEYVRIEHWVVAQQTGRTAARNILGAEERFRAVPFFWSRHYDTSLHYVGSAVEWEDAVPIGDPRHGKGAVLLQKGGRTIAVASAGDPRVSLEAELALESADPAAIADWERRLRARL